MSLSNKKELGKKSYTARPKQRAVWVYQKEPLWGTKPAGAELTSVKIRSGKIVSSKYGRHHYGRAARRAASAQKREKNTGP